VELLTITVPNLLRVGLLANPDSPNFDPVLKNVRAAAKEVGLVLVPVEMRSPQEVPSAFATMTRERVGAVMVMSDALTVMQRDRIAELALKSRLPTILPLREYVVAGGLMAYGNLSSERKSACKCIQSCKASRSTKTFKRMRGSISQPLPGGITRVALATCSPRRRTQN
jgi:ABC transporter substrate binding protein